MAVGEGVMGLPVQVTAGVMHMNPNPNPSPSPSPSPNPNPSPSPNPNQVGAPLGCSG